MITPSPSFLPPPSKTSTTARRDNCFLYKAVVVVVDSDSEIRATNRRLTKRTFKATCTQKQGVGGVCALVGGGGSKGEITLETSIVVTPVVKVGSASMTPEYRPFALTSWALPSVWLLLLSAILNGNSRFPGLERERKEAGLLFIADRHQSDTMSRLEVSRYLWKCVRARACTIKRS